MLHARGPRRSVEPSQLLKPPISVEVTSVTDTSLTTAGFGGIGMGSVITSGDDVSGQELDDFEMYAITSGSPGTTATTTHYIHTDHLGGTNVATDENGKGVEVVDYYPFGEGRISKNTTAFSEQRKFIGEEYDGDTGLSYLNARYYGGSRGQFVSQDPVFREMGVDERTERVLADPQMLNSYSYSRNNPLILQDSNGELAITVPTLIFIGVAGIIASSYGGVAIKQSVNDRASQKAVREAGKSIDRMLRNLRRARFQESEFGRGAAITKWGRMERNCCGNLCGSLSIGT